MHADLEVRRRVLLLTYQRYQQADRAWTLALQEMNRWFPAGSRPGAFAIGDPGSPIRRLYERRERALLQMETARLKLEVARERLAARQQATQGMRVMFVTHLKV